MSNPSRPPSLVFIAAAVIAGPSCDAIPGVPDFASDLELPRMAGPLLTWQQDPTSTMTIDWYGVVGDSGADYFAYRKSEENAVWLEVQSTEHENPVPGYVTHRVELTGLEPDGTYDFLIPAGEFRFRTLPKTLSRPVQFAAGGDVRVNQPRMDATNRQVAKRDVDFILWGGDLAYADADPERLDRWEDFLESVGTTLVREDGRAIPILAAIGNHEVEDSFYHRHDGYTQTDEGRQEIAPYYYSLFVFPGQPGYGVLDAGDYLSLVALDTDHTNPVGGEQAEWLRETLEERQDVQAVLPFYHVTGFPSHRSFEGDTETRVRENWVPLFEEFGVDVVFENHDHTYKRTRRIRDGEPHPEGITYLGDGAWGVPPREPRSPSEKWYLKVTESVKHFIHGTISQEEMRFEMVDQDGGVFDEYVRELDP